LVKRVLREQWDRKRARAETRGYTAAFHPELRRHIHEIRALVANASLSLDERQQLRQLGELLLTQISAEATVA
jgi:hypothetical protein